MSQAPIADGTPQYRDCVMKSFRKLQVKSSVYEQRPPVGAGIRLGIYQVQASYGPGATEKNMARFERAVKLAARHGVGLLAFPELFVTGYTMDPDWVSKVAEFADGPSVTQASYAAAERNMSILLPYVEKAEADYAMAYYDSIAVINEKGELLESYRKTHLYGQQERDNFSLGESTYPVHNLSGFPVGVLNCYECENPELIRILALEGAKLIVGPTAADSYYRLPDGTMSNVPYPDVSEKLFPAWALSNNLFFAYVNRCGYESRDGNNWHYRGNSCVYGPHGDKIVAAGHEQDTLLVADCVPAYYGATHPAPDYNYLQDRRPELYDRLTATEAKFHNQSVEQITLETDLFAGGHTYPMTEKISSY
jgi:predicted amidohydrolase